MKKIFNILILLLLSLSGYTQTHLDTLVLNEINKHRTKKIIIDNKYYKSSFNHNLNMAEYNDSILKYSRIPITGHDDYIFGDTIKFKERYKNIECGEIVTFLFKMSSMEIDTNKLVDNIYDVFYKSIQHRKIMLDNKWEYATASIYFYESDKSMCKGKIIYVTILFYNIE